MIIRSEAWPSLDAGGAVVFIEAREPGVIFLSGAEGQLAERIAVRLRDLRHEMLGLVRVAVGSAAAEPALQRRLGLGRLPGVAWVGGGDVLARLEGVQAWHRYTAATDEALTRLSRNLAERRDGLF